MNLPATNEPVVVPEFQVVGPEHAQALAGFFERLRAQDVEKFFHPHPLTAEEAQKRAAYRGLDFYCVQVLDNAVVGYGMLRGWDEGFEVPSIGVVVDPSVKGRGYGRSLMKFLRATARQRGGESSSRQREPRQRQDGRVLSVAGLCVPRFGKWTAGRVPAFGSAGWRVARGKCQMRIGILDPDFITRVGGMDFLRPILDVWSAPLGPRERQITTSIGCGETPPPTVVTPRDFAESPRFVLSPRHWN